MREGNDPVRQPIPSPAKPVGIKWGKLKSALLPQITTPVLVDEYRFEENSLGTGGSWVATGKTFKAIDRCLPLSLTAGIPAGKWVGCHKVGRTIYAVLVVECAVD